MPIEVPGVVRVKVITVCHFRCVLIGLLARHIDYLVSLNNGGIFAK